VTADIKPYPAYKDSGVPWLGDVPEHWDVGRLRSALVRNDSGCWGSDFSASGSLVLRSNEQTVDGTWQIVAPARRLLSHKEQSESRLVEGDLVITKSSGSSKHIGKTSLVTPEIAAMECCFSNFMQRIRLDATVEPKLAWYWLNSQVGRGQLVYESNTTTGLANLNGVIIGNLSFGFPPLSEQVAIVRYLDHADRKVRQAIRARQQLIKLLTEQKQSVIQHAVTLGLDPNVRLKPSGVPWLGDVPEHWETPLNQQVFREEIRPHGGMPEMQLSLSQHHGLIATRDMQERSLQTASYDNWKVTVPGDLVLNRFKAHLGVFFAASLRGIVSFHYGVFAPKRVLDTKYFELLFHTYPYRMIYAGCSNGMTVGLQNLSNQNFYNVRCVVPPISEQVAIVACAERETQTLNTSISKLEHEISLLREYRTRLIADVVTGKLDVRGVKVPDDETDVLPEDVETIDDVEAIDQTDDVAEGDSESSSEESA